MLEFVEGTLSPALSSAVAGHIRQCPSCTHELEGHSSRTRALQKLGRMKAPDQWPEISRSIRHAGWMYFVRRYGLPAAIFGVSAALVLVGASTYLGEPARVRQTITQVDSIAMMPALTGSVEPVKQLFEAAASVETAATERSQTGRGGDAGSIAAELGALEADHYGNVVGQFLDEGAILAVAKSGA